jgi:hypothetical protein
MNYITEGLDWLFNLVHWTVLLHHILLLILEYALLQCGRLNSHSNFHLMRFQNVQNFRQFPIADFASSNLKFSCCVIGTFEHFQGYYFRNFGRSFLVISQF